MQSATPLPLAGAEHDRAVAHRSDVAWLAARRDDPRTRVLLVDGEHVPVCEADGEGAHLALVSPAVLDAATRAATLLLGVDAAGHALLAADADEAAPAAAADARRVHLRDVAALLPAAESGLAAHAVALLGWHRRHRFCPRCGAPTEVVEAGHMRRCTDPRDGSLHHPRTDPCVIVLVHDGDRVLLGRRPTFPPGRFSVLAGFVEPGETLEAAVLREVEEESGVRVAAETVAYVASQPWPFPASLMLGFTAAAATTAIEPHDGELEEVRWMARAEVLRAVAAGELQLPPPASIARHLLDGWLLLREDAAAAAAG